MMVESVELVYGYTFTQFFTKMIRKNMSVRKSSTKQCILSNKNELSGI